MAGWRNCILGLALLLLPPIAVAGFPIESHAKCCRVCKSGIACGNGCIQKSKICDKPKGCACSTGKGTPLNFLEEPPAVLQAAILEIIDGDTLRVRVKGWPKKIADARLRVKQIDTPEIRHAQCEGERSEGEKAKAHVQALLPVGSKISFVLGAKNTDSFGRYLADVTLPSGRDFADTLVAAGLAIRYDGGAKPDWCS